MKNASKPGTTKSDEDRGSASSGVKIAMISTTGLIVVAIIGFLPYLIDHVLRPAATATPVAAEIAAPTPTNTPADTVTITPDVTAAPEWGARITYPDFNTEPLKTRFVDLIGEYQDGMTDAIWVWVQDPQGRYFPGSMDPCQGQSAPKVNGKWEIFVGVGVDENSGDFNLVLSTATPDANTFIAESLKSGCVNGGYPGFASLPPGVTERQRASVTRRPTTGAEDIYPLAPPIPDAGLPGIVSVDPFGDHGIVTTEQIITGTVTGGSGSVWGLVYTFYGRWYPQSFVPCAGDHTRQEGAQWQVRAIFGGDPDSGKPFGAVLVLANEEANKFLDQKQRDFCAANHYPGFLTIELPDGLSEKYASPVIRK